jgi:hypothetical protein
MRPETGPMQFGNDWCGVFLRGDNALYYALVLEMLTAHLLVDPVSGLVIRGLIDDLKSCAGNPESAQKLAEYERCAR